MRLVPVSGYSIEDTSTLYPTPSHSAVVERERGSHLLWLFTEEIQPLPRVNHMLPQNTAGTDRSGIDSCMVSGSSHASHNRIYLPDTH